MRQALSSFALSTELQYLFKNVINQIFLDALKVHFSDEEPEIASKDARHNAIHDSDVIGSVIVAFMFFREIARRSSATNALAEILV